MTKVKVVASEYMTCPYCGSNNVDLWEMVYDDGVYFDEEYICADCKRHFRQCFSRRLGWHENLINTGDCWEPAYLYLGLEVEYEEQKGDETR